MCGIVGIYNHPQAANLAYLCLYALQHRGQESAGIAVSTGDSIHYHKGMGLVADVFDKDVLKKLPGPIAIGHTRYSTSGKTVGAASLRRCLDYSTAGEPSIKNAQPIVGEYGGGKFALAHNGNLVNTAELRAELEEKGSIFQSTIDSEIVMHLIVTSKGRGLKERVIDALSKFDGAYSLVFLNEDSLIAARDPQGFRPLVLGRLGSAVVVASETCALDLIDAEYIREVEPGEVLVINKNGIESCKPFSAPKRTSLCIFEHIYFSRPDSLVFGRSVYEMRKEFGRQLAREHPADADMVVPVPDSGIPSAIGYANESGLPFELGLVRNHYIGRVFIEPENETRHTNVKIKLIPDRDILENKRIVVIDDSIVRGITSRKIVQMLKNGGAKEVHVRVASPPNMWPCYYGIDTPTKEELIASTRSVEEIRRFIDADSLGYLSYEGLHHFKKDVRQGANYCDACFTGDYPIRVSPPL